MWARVDDGWWCHPKVMLLSLPASGLWVRALSWSCAQRKPIVPPQFLTLIGATPEVADELVEAGLWKRAGDGYEIHDWAEYQEKTVSEKRAEAGRKGGLSRGKAKQTEATRSKTEASGQAGTQPSPAQPVPTPGLPAATRGKQAAIVIARNQIADRVASGAIADPVAVAKKRAEEDLWPVLGDRLTAAATEHPDATPEALAAMVDVDPLAPAGYPSVDQAAQGRPRLTEWTPPDVEFADPSVARAALARARGREAVPS